ncbi:radical SAM protein [Methanothermococcus sp. SCGC AD-155-M21]|nr:radical SAM protein [Methanothermococcus sp. SCGC AD-155-M21]
MDIEELNKELLKKIDNLPVGCQQCINGEKLVLFITGICGENCYYCPISEKRKEKDVIYANERKINSIEECIEECLLCGSKGVGITGGNPLLKIEKTYRYIKALKKRFGPSFHIHLYTTPTVIDENKLKTLKEAGLDEIRLHPTKYFNKYYHYMKGEGKKHNSNKEIEEYLGDFLDTLKLCTKYIKDVVVEIPSIPRYENEIIYLLEEIEKIGVRFININQLEYSETNYRTLKSMGFLEKNTYTSEILGSEETAKIIIDYFNKKIENGKSKLTIHYCPSILKDGIQMKNRLINRAKNVAKEYEVITNEGLLLRGIVSFKDIEDVKDLLEILEYNTLPYEIDENKYNIYLSPYVLEDIVDYLKDNIYNFKFGGYISERYPTHDELEVERIPLIIKKRSLKDLRKNME